jgi:pilus assembly protein Flp/PilA
LIADNPKPSTTFGRDGGHAPLSRPKLLRSESHFDEEFAMIGVVRKVQHFLVSEDGPTAVEYCVMLALIMAVGTVVLKALGTQASGSFSSVSSSLS